MKRLKLKTNTIDQHYSWFKTIRDLPKQLYIQCLRYYYSAPLRSGVTSLETPSGLHELPVNLNGYLLQMGNLSFRSRLHT